MLKQIMKRSALIKRYTNLNGAAMLCVMGITNASCNNNPTPEVVKKIDNESLETDDATVLKQLKEYLSEKRLKDFMLVVGLGQKKILSTYSDNVNKVHDRATSLQKLWTNLKMRNMHEPKLPGRPFSLLGLFCALQFIFLKLCF